MVIRDGQGESVPWIKGPRNQHQVQIHNENPGTFQYKSGNMSNKSRKTSTRLHTRVDRWSNEHCVGYWKILLIAMFSWVLFFCTHLLFTFLDKVILHLCLANLNSIFRMKNEWVVRKNGHFFHKKIARKFLDPKTHFWKFTFLGKVILHMPVKFEQARMKNEWVVRKKR